MTQGVAEQQPETTSAGATGVLYAPDHRDEVIWKLEVMSRRGRLPGFRRVPEGCVVAAHGNPFDKAMILHAADADGGGSRFTPELRLERRMPVVTLIIFVLVVWPGVLLTDSFMRMHLGFYQKWHADGLETWWWYIPLTVVSLVWAWIAAIRKTERTASASARETLEKIASEVGGRIQRDGV